MPYILVAACYFLVGTRLPQVAACMGSTAFDPGSVHRFIQNGTGRCHQDIFGGDIPSGKRLHNYGKIHHAIKGKIHYFYGHFQ
jgi:hypothetical protein